jgi:hypothetical protein
MDTRTLMDSEWVKPNINVKNGDHLRILDEGHIVPDKKGEDQLELNVEIVRDGEVLSTKKFSLNKTNHKAIAGAHGYDSKHWIGKKFRVNIVKKQNPQGQLVDSIALSLPNVDAEGNIIFGQ